MIEGGAGTAITPEASNITVTGFTISTDDAGTPIRTTGADINRLRISDNIIEGGASGVWFGAGGNEIGVSFNLIKGDEYGIRLAAGYSELTIRHNRLVGPATSYGVFAGADAGVDDFRLEGNEFARASLDASITNGWILSNKIKPPAGGVGLRANLTESDVRENSIRGQGAAGCLQLLGSQGDLDPSSRVFIFENEFAGCMPYGLQLGPEVEKITVTTNTFPDTYDGVVTDDSSPWDVTGSGIAVYSNRFVGLTHLGVYNAVSGELDARYNWWGCNGGPGTAGCDDISSGVDASSNVVLTAEAFEMGSPWTAAPVKSLNPGEQAWIRAFLKDGDGSEALNVSIISDNPVYFSSPKGTFLWASSGWSNAEAGSVFTAGPQPGPAGLVVTMDNQQVEVPLTISGELPEVSPAPAVQSPPSPSPPLINQPQIRIRIPGNTLNLPNRKAVIGVVSCAQSACRVDQRSAEVRVGGMRYPVELKVPSDIAAENIGQIRVVMPERAIRQLSRHGTGMLIITIKMTDASDGAVSMTRRVKIAWGGP